MYVPRSWMVLIFTLLLPLCSQAQYNATPDYWQCSNRIGGTWSFGNAPEACDADSFGDVNYVRNYMKPLRFSDTAERTAERNRYMGAMYPVLRDVADYYIRLRKPSVSGAELEAWRRAVFSLAHQESYWTHYREASDSRLKMMRGDAGHGHGIMQVDDRWHFVAVNDHKGFNLVANILYSMEEYYAGWERAPGSGCVSSPSNWRDRARAAYSAYNGGPSKICRFTNPNDTWARNDVGFAQKWDGQGWLGNVANTSAPAPVNVSCLIQGGEVCAPPGDPTAGWAGRLLKLDNSRTCVYSGGALQCVTDLRDAVLCLAPFVHFDPNSVLNLTAAQVNGINQAVHDRHQCRTWYAGVTPLYGVSNFVKPKIAINLRTTPGGTLIGSASAGTTYQVLDFELRGIDSLDRYYRIKVGSKEGYIYAGDRTDNQSWAGTAASVSPRVVALANDYITIVMSGGINLRAMPGGTLVGVVPGNAMVRVEQVVVRSDSNDIYYQLVYNGVRGFIYSGSLLPSNTVAQWTKRS